MVQEQSFISVTSNTVSVRGVTKIVSMFDKEAVFCRENERITVSGVGLGASKLELEQGILDINYQTLFAIKLSGNKGGKSGFLGMFK